MVRLRATQELLAIDSTLLPLGQLPLVLDAVVLLLARVRSMDYIPSQYRLVFEVKWVVIFHEIAAVAFVNDARRHQLLLGVRTLLEFGMRVQVAELFEGRRLLHDGSLLAVATLGFGMLVVNGNDLLFACELRRVLI